MSNTNDKSLKDGGYRPSAYETNKFVKPPGKEVKFSGSWAMFPDGTKVHTTNPEGIKKRL